MPRIAAGERNGVELETRLVNLLQLSPGIDIANNRTNL